MLTIDSQKESICIILTLINCSVDNLNEQIFYDVLEEDIKKDFYKVSHGKDYTKTLLIFTKGLFDSNLTIPYISITPDCKCRIGHIRSNLKSISLPKTIVEFILFNNNYNMICDNTSRKLYNAISNVSDKVKLIDIKSKDDKNNIKRNKIISEKAIRHNLYNRKDENYNIYKNVESKSYNNELTIFSPLIITNTIYSFYKKSIRYYQLKS